MRVPLGATPWGSAFGQVHCTGATHLVSAQHFWSEQRASSSCLSMQLQPDQLSDSARESQPHIMTTAPALRFGQNPGGEARRDVLLRTCHLTALATTLFTCRANADAPPLLRSCGDLSPAFFGVQIYDDATAYKLTLQALEVGFRSFFTSADADNQLGFARAIVESGIPRDELFIASSVLSDYSETFRRGKALTSQAFALSMDTLARGGVDKLDMALLERPALTATAVRGQWRGLRDARDANEVSLLGVCNFGLPQLDALREERPCMHQLGFSLGIRMPHSQVVAAHRERGIQLQAWSPLGGPDSLIPRALLTRCAAIGKSRGRSAQQVALRWVVQSGAGFCVHSRSRSHLADDLAVFDFELSEDEMSALSSMAREPLL